MNGKASSKCGTAATGCIVIMDFNATAAPRIVLANNSTGKRTSASVHNVCYEKMLVIVFTATA